MTGRREPRVQRLPASVGLPEQGYVWQTEASNDVARPVGGPVVYHYNMDRMVTGYKRPDSGFNTWPLIEWGDDY